MLWLGGWHAPAELFMLLAVLIFVTHRANIARLMAGTETKIGAKAG
jgi:acyl phosphate:glycerol-3-phosphate acyltransferase